MKTILDEGTRDEIIRRIGTLDAGSPAQWGKMTPYQMAKHCTLWEDMMQGKVTYKRNFIGRFVGPMVLKKVLKDETPLTHNTPTLLELKIRNDGDMLAQKREWIARVEGYANLSNDGIMHPFFGKMTKEQIGRLVYKHIDHHLRQFNA